MEEKEVKDEPLKKKNITQKYKVIFELNIK